MFLWQDVVQLGDRHQKKLASYLPGENQKGVLSSLMIEFQRNGPRSLEKTFLGLKTGKRLI